ncbi:hypothetical protein I7I50_10880 [Histoplasma capsulatum G186AR]|uniref:Uncharacterized protein n=1 Tax=Ajellomyces capsulatus TaxID=5037 RepID=A0A8H7Z4E1_AJECA|nr:hypothetical protein I7I52_02119 [Histoplasma capsulatum]QSS69553.1 hypothetical protein I7I50_10880 [Histoplasma capsulatum G186AR]
MKAKGCLAQRWSRNLNPPNKPKYSGRICGLLASEKEFIIFLPAFEKRLRIVSLHVSRNNKANRMGNEHFQ